MVKTKAKTMNLCPELHKLVHSAKRYTYPFALDAIPLNGIYILFEEGEHGHQGDRIVRVGTHRGVNQLCSRLKQHFLIENKDRSIFRKNIGRAILNSKKDSFYKQWEHDLTPAKNKKQYSGHVYISKSQIIEKEVSRYIQQKFSFVVFEIEEKELRLELEKRLISTISLCNECRPSKNWFGYLSPISKIQQSGLWQIQHLYKTPLDEHDLQSIKKALS